MKGPILIKIFSCKDCIHLVDTTGLNFSIQKPPYLCNHKDIVIQEDELKLEYPDCSTFFVCPIRYDKITPDICPLLFKRNRVEKLK